MLVFVRDQSPLSNFHKSMFVLNGVTYDCNERYYVYGKADFANDGRALEAVMRAESPLECKKISEGLNRKINVKAWVESSAERVMLEGIKAKFGQNPHLRTYLLRTDEKVLVEATPNDTHWSHGLSNKDTVNLMCTDRWPGKNRLGEWMCVND